MNYYPSPSASHVPPLNTQSAPSAYQKQRFNNAWLYFWSARQHNNPRTHTDTKMAQGISKEKSQ